MNNSTTLSRVFEHPGPLCKAIRELRLPLMAMPTLTLNAMADRCGVTVRTLQYFEHGDRLLSDEAFDAYTHALTGVPEDIVQLQMLYRSYQNRRVLEQELHHYNFHTITWHPLLRTALRRLEARPRPAFIMDDLAFCSVMNANFAALFHLDQRALSSPYLWHMVSTNFYPASPVRKAQISPYNAYCTYAVRMFHQALAQYFFTYQSLSLQQCLLTLAPDEYGKLWSSYLLLTESKWTETPVCVIRYNREPSMWRIEKLDTVAAPIVHGPVLFYHLFEWVPVDDKAERICAEVVTQRHELIFAREFGLEEYTCA